MKHHVDPYRPFSVGLFELDGTEKVSELGDAIRARQAEVDEAVEEESAHMRLLKLAGHVRQSTVVTSGRYGRWPELCTYPHRMWRAPRRTKVKPGDGTVRHDASTTRAIERCEELGLEFWALAPRGEVWAVDSDREYVLVMRYGRQEKWTATEPARPQ